MILSEWFKRVNFPFLSVKLFLAEWNFRPSRPSTDGYKSKRVTLCSSSLKKLAIIIDIFFRWAKPFLTQNNKTPIKIQASSFSTVAFLLIYVPESINALSDINTYLSKYES